jgi:thymidylate synthase (FAD)
LETTQKVSLINFPEKLLDIIYTACRTCYSSDDPHNIFNGGHDEKKKLNIVRKVINSQHTSTLEHITFTFTISGVSRCLSHQLVRHRHSNYSQRSQRYVTEKGGFNYIIPDKVKNSSALPGYTNLMEKIYSFYEECINEHGLPAEDARYVLPNACETSFTFSTNLRELIHIAGLRLCVNSQKEIRDLVKKMCSLIVEKEPWLDEYLQPKCVRLGQCEEFNKCGRY